MSRPGRILFSPLPTPPSNLHGGSVGPSVLGALPAATIIYSDINRPSSPERRHNNPSLIIQHPLRGTYSPPRACRSPSPCVPTGSEDLSRPHSPVSLATRYGTALRESIRDPWVHIEHLHSILRTRDEEISRLRGSETQYALDAQAKVIAAKEREIEKLRNELILLKEKYESLWAQVGKKESISGKD